MLVAIPCSSYSYTRVKTEHYLSNVIVIKLYISFLTYNFFSMKTKDKYEKGVNRFSITKYQQCTFEQST